MRDRYGTGARQNLNQDADRGEERRGEGGFGQPTECYRHEGGDTQGVGGPEVKEGARAREAERKDSANIGSCRKRVCRERAGSAIFGNVTAGTNLGDGEDELKVFAWDEFPGRPEGAICKVPEANVRNVRDGEGK